jgi:hypothetical protein
VAHPTSEERIAAEEERLGRRLPDDLRARLLDENGGEIQVVVGEPSPDPADDVWELVGVADVVKRKGRPRPVEGFADVTEREAAERELPHGAVVLATDGGGDLLLLLADDELAVFRHEDGDVEPATVRRRVA